MATLYNHYTDWAIPAYTISVGKSSKWENPYLEGIDGTRAEVYEKYRRMVHAKPKLLREIKETLRGRDLVCWCHPKCEPETCHGTTLLRIAND